ncbi:hypothetical protein IFM89_017472 [Coptis chinensis]|uniref:F-box domain-containing protein n=1 Tax=Coptis chinensis TaxID=261450 RepID=A0A835LRI0_9MAGN|nr:hypothetical protein IFM89_017472 [Coptis chinensis]
MLPYQEEKKRRSDMISYFPQEIRDHIVSFLPLEDAIRTSILSKQWRKVCSTLSNLDFNQRHFFQLENRNLQDFKAFIYQTINLHDESDIELFKLYVDQADDEFVCHISEWVSFAFAHHVRQLQLWVLDDECQKFPFCLFSSDSLTSLILVNINLKLPKNVKFPNLRYSRFFMVEFFDDDTADQFFSNCPVLETFRFQTCSMRHHNIFTISAPNLKFLMLEPMYSPPEIKITSTNLQQIIFNGTPPPAVNLYAASCSLYRATFRFASLPATEVIDHSTRKILLELRTVKELILGPFFIEFLTRGPDLSAQLPVSCSSVEHLHLEMYPTRNQVHVITLLLRSYPNLQTLRLSVEREQLNASMFDLEEHCEIQELRDDGILKELKIVEFEYFEGSESELNLVRYLLENANVLEDLNIIFSKQDQIEATHRIDITEKMQTLTRASPYVAVSITKSNMDL